MSIANLDTNTEIANPIYNGVFKNIRASQGFKLNQGAGLNKLLTSDALGNGTWQNAPSSGQPQFTPFIVSSSGPYFTIQSAVDAASSAPYSGIEQLILVDSGTYNEYVIVPSSSAYLRIVAISSSSPSGVVVIGGFENRYSSNLVLENLYIFGDGAHNQVLVDGGLLSTVPYLKMYNCTAFGNGSFSALEVGENAVVQVLSCTFEGGQFAISSDADSSMSTIYINDSQLNTFGTDSIHLAGGGTSVLVTIRDTNVQGNVGYALNTNNTVIVNSSKNNFTNGTTVFETAFLDSTANMLSTYDVWNSTATSGYFITGNVGSQFFWGTGTLVLEGSALTIGPNISASALPTL